MSRDLKGENRKYEVAFLIGNFAFWCLLAVPQLASSWSVEILKTEVAPLATVTLVLTILVLVLDGIVPARIKEVITFWRISNAAPAHRAFSDIAQSDHRVDVGALVNSIGDLPDDPQRQHSLWMQLLNKNRSDRAVLASEKPYLLMRNLSVLSSALLVAYPFMLLIVTEDSWLTLGYLSILVMQFVGISKAAQGFAIRFVGTVLHKAIV